MKKAKTKRARKKAPVFDGVLVNPFKSAMDEKESLLNALGTSTELCRFYFFLNFNNKKKGAERFTIGMVSYSLKIDLASCWKRMNKMVELGVLHKTKKKIRNATVYSPGDLLFEKDCLDFCKKRISEVKT